MFAGSKDAGRTRRSSRQAARGERIIESVAESCLPTASVFDAVRLRSFGSAWITTSHLGLVELQSLHTNFFL